MVFGKGNCDTSLLTKFLGIKLSQKIKKANIITRKEWILRKNNLLENFFSHHDGINCGWLFAIVHNMNDFRWRNATGIPIWNVSRDESVITFALNNKSTSLKLNKWLYKSWNVYLSLKTHICCTEANQTFLYIFKQLHRRFVL